MHFIYKSKKLQRTKALQLYSFILQQNPFVSHPINFPHPDHPPKGVHQWPAIVKCYAGELGDQLNAEDNDHQCDE